MGQVDLGSRVLLPALADVPGHLFWRATARVTQSLDRVLPPGVDIHAHAVLLALAGGAVRSQQELADLLLTSRTTIARVAGELAASGLVDRVRNPADRRSYALSRTPEGAATAARWRTHADDVESAITAGFSADERADLTRLLTKLVEPELAADLPGDLRTSVGFLLTRVHARMHRDLAVALESLDIEPRDFGSLHALVALGPVPQAELARAMGVSGPTIVEVADRLEQRHLVERRRDPQDRRSQRLVLLPRSAAVHRTAEVAVVACTEDTLTPLTASEVTTLVALLRRFVTAP